MADEDEVKNDGSAEVYDDHSVDNSVHHAVNLWPLAIIGVVAAALIAASIFLPDAKHRAETVPNGKSYQAIGNIVDCLPLSQFGNGPYRSFVRTPREEFFSVYWRRDFQPPIFGAAIGELKYHQCGQQDGVTVHCFDSFAVSSQRVKVLDLSPDPAKK
jgi:hypothetical protein